MSGRHGAVWFWVAVSLALGGCKSKGSDSSGKDAQVIEVIRVESPGPESPGAEHCDRGGKKCSPLAASQKIPARGLVRTFAGGKVSLDFGAGRRIDLDSLSQLELDQQRTHLKEGEFSLDTTPLITKESRNAEPLTFSVAGRDFVSTQDQPTRAALSVHDGEAWLTVRRGRVNSPQLDLHSRAGQSVRIAHARAFRSAEDGSELPQLLPFAPRQAEFDGLLDLSNQAVPRGLGTMSARLPNTDQKRDGVRLLKHHATVVIQDGYARTKIEEEFENTTPHILEGNYRFAVPSDASISQLGLWVGDRLMQGEVLERDRAARIYSSIVDRPLPRDPALLEWESGGEMSLKVFPILPKKTRRVELTYHQALSAEGGLLRYMHPLSLGPDRTTEIDDFAITIVAHDSTAQLNGARVLGYDARVSEQAGRIEAEFSARHFRPHRDFSLVVARAQSSAAQLAIHANGTERHFGLRLTADLPDEARRPDFRPLARAIVIDVSHSQSQQTIAAQSALAFGLLLEMDPDESFVLLACDSACEAWTPSEGSEPTQSRLELPPRLAGAHRFLSGLKPGGSSDVAGALASAVARLGLLGPDQNRAQQIVYLGDGRPTSGELSAEAIARRVGPLLGRVGTELRLVGVGHALDGDALRGLAVELDATLDFLASGIALQDRIWELSSRLRRPVVHVPRLTLPQGFIAAETRALPALHLGQEILISGEFSELAPGDLTLSGTLDGAPYRLTKTIQVTNETRRNNPQIPSLWARNRISLLQSLDPTPTIEAEIIDLSKRYRTMSRYTSFLVLESDEMYEEFGIDRPEREREDAGSGYEGPDALRLDREHIAQEAHEQNLDEHLWPPPSLAGARKSASAPAPRPRPTAAPKPSRTVPGAAVDGLGSRGSAAEAMPSEGWGDENASVGEGGTSRPQVSAPEPSPPAVGSQKGASAEDSAPRKDKLKLGASWSGLRHRGRSYAPPRFHLSAVQADDEWRKWGEDHLAELEHRVRTQAESRAHHEALVRGLLGAGRFSRAHAAATRFFELDPDHQTAIQLLASSSVVTENHEQARRLLDVENELIVDDPELHLQAARAFSAVGDLVRACAHARSAAALDWKNEDVQTEADACWQEVLGTIPARNTTHLGEGQSGQVQVTIRCDPPTSPRDCPAPIVISPFGEVVSPWTPGPGKTHQLRVSLVRLRSGDYFVLVAGGSPDAQGWIEIAGRNENASIAFSGGGLHTVAKMTLKYF